VDRQGAVSAGFDAASMPDDHDPLLRALFGGDDQAATQILSRAAATTSPALLVAAALLTPEPSALLARAATSSVTTRDRQLLAIAIAHLDGDEELLDALVRDHLAEHPDNILAAWIAAQHTRPGHPAHLHP
jgi:hypothetical protein